MKSKCSRMKEQLRGWNLHYAYFEGGSPGVNTVCSSVEDLSLLKMETSYFEQGNEKSFIVDRFFFGFLFFLRENI